MLFRNLVFSALFVGLISGGLSTAVQFFQVIPIIISAEAFEGEPAPATTSEKTEHNGGLKMGLKEQHIRFLQIYSRLLGLHF
jgi:predicted cobalt transporter CbtA